MTKKILFLILVVILAIVSIEFVNEFIATPIVVPNKQQINNKIDYIEPKSVTIPKSSNTFLDAESESLLMLNMEIQKQELLTKLAELKKRALDATPSNEPPKEKLKENDLVSNFFPVPTDTKSDLSKIEQVILKSKIIVNGKTIVWIEIDGQLHQITKDINLYDLNFSFTAKGLTVSDGINVKVLN